MKLFKNINFYKLLLDALNYNLKWEIYAIWNII